MQHHRSYPSARKFSYNYTALLNDTLIQAVGCAVEDQKGKPLGRVTEVTRDAAGGHIEYIILKSEVCLGPGDRFFAIPASSGYFKIMWPGRLVLQRDKDELQFAKGVDADKCPHPDFKKGSAIYEIYKYKMPNPRSEAPP